jgi:shikimate dehydrogenase
MISAKTNVVALIGNPVRKSFSPYIHNYFIEKYSIDAVYVVFELKEENLKNAFNGAKKLGFKGLNVTMPFKKKVFAIVDKNDTIASAISSVNTVKFDSKKEIAAGFNTDVGGFIKSLDKKKFKWKGSNCLVIGAGGAARSVIYGLILKKVKKIWIYNRTQKKVSEIIKDFKNFKGVIIQTLDNINNINDRIDDIDLIVNCTPLGMYDKEYKNIMPVPVNWNLKGKFIFDLVYNPVDTLLMKKARREGAEVIEGIELLVNQAALSFKIWFGIMPEDKYIDNIKNKILRDMTKVN